MFLFFGGGGGAVQTRQPTMWPPNTLFSINFVLGQDSPGPHMYKEWSDGGGDEGRKSSQEDSMSEEEMDEMWRSEEGIRDEWRSGQRRKKKERKEGREKKKMSEDEVENRGL